MLPSCQPSFIADSPCPNKQVESAKLMRQAADILSSAPAMQIRYLEAMQAMAKSANSKVIFLPAQNTATMQGLNTSVPNPKEWSDEQGEGSGNNNVLGDFGGDASFQQAMSARVIENI